MMFVVVPGEKRVRPGAGVRQAAETVGIVRALLQGFELRLGKRIVIGHVRVGMAFGDAQIGHQQVASSPCPGIDISRIATSG